ncbi:hypothetical protein F383_04903 [Gossypium arboreum]|uniref:Uncharacterized protein n=1 Tax=Gossypium arboreum TaxID=29729 RepID=A0A0B0P7V6_GOSAR|nr:hypothetical protein F383_04903 [Gossypium arboreum]
MKDVEATGSLGIVEDHHHTIELHFGRTLNGWQIGLVDGLFLPTRVGARVCVLAMLFEGHFEMSLSRPHGAHARGV